MQVVLIIIGIISVILLGFQVRKNYIGFKNSINSFFKFADGQFLKSVKQNTKKNK